MKIHKEGLKIVTITAVIVSVLNVIVWVAVPVWWWAVVPSAVLLFVGLWTVWFFRVPNRTPAPEEQYTIYAPADGEVVTIEQVYESEYFKDERIQVSIFMSIWNVHMNWFPTAGQIKYFRHHHGKFLVAWHPKSSTDNERTTTVVESPSGHPIMFRQIAGFVARRIVNYSKEGETATQNANFGFIKFGSRVDIFLPLGTHINVEIGDDTVGTKTPIAQLHRCN